MFDSVDIMEGKLDSMSPVGTDLETVKQQIEELKVLLSCLCVGDFLKVLFVKVIVDLDQSLELFISSLFHV